MAGGADEKKEQLITYSPQKRWQRSNAANCLITSPAYKASYEQATSHQNPNPRTFSSSTEQTKLPPLPDVGYHDSAAIAPKGVLQQSSELAVTVRNMHRLALQREIISHLVNKYMYRYVHVCIYIFSILFLLTCTHLGKNQWLGINVFF